MSQSYELRVVYSLLGDLLGGLLCLLGAGFLGGGSLLGDLLGPGLLDGLLCPLGGGGLLDDFLGG